MPRHPFAGMENDGVEGVRFRVVERLYVQGEPELELNDTVTLYVPTLLALNAVTVGLGSEDVKPLGPVQAYVGVIELGKVELKFTARFAVAPFVIH